MCDLHMTLIAKFEIIKYSKSRRHFGNKLNRKGSPIHYPIPVKFFLEKPTVVLDWMAIVFHNYIWAFEELEKWQFAKWGG